jgi:hypothetical protein
MKIGGNKNRTMLRLEKEVGCVERYSSMTHHLSFLAEEARELE